MMPASAGPPTRRSRQAPAPAAATSRVDTAHVDTVHVADWEQFDYASHVIAKTDLTPLPLVDLQHIRAIIFGKHGRVFQDTTLQRWLASRPWYHADTSFTNARLRGQERVNLDLVREAEAAKHTQVESGDMRFYQNRVLTTAMLGTHTPQDWEVLEAEVLAEHGFVFDKAEDLDESGRVARQTFRSTSTSATGTSANRSTTRTQLSAIEQQNRDTITLAMTRQQGRRLAFGHDESVPDEPADRSDAGRRPDRRSASAAQRGVRPSWSHLPDRRGSRTSSATTRGISRVRTTPTPSCRRWSGRTSRSSRPAKSNFTTSSERARCRSTTSEACRPDDARLLRNEIYARHGRRFRDPRLQKYFASFAWYHPSDAFRENQLNDTERKNVTLISQYESGRFTEG